MDEVPSVHLVLINETFRLNKINKIKDYIVAEIRERILMNKGLSRYIAAFTVLINL